MAKTKKTAQTVELGDCVERLSTLGPEKVDLVIADSPYNIGQAYDSYTDNLPHEAFMEWMRTWLERASACLRPEGSLWVFAPDEFVSELDVMIRRRIGLHRRSHVVWGMGFGVACQQNFSRSHVHLLYFTKHRKKFTFNADAVRVPSNRQLVYGDKRAAAKGKLPDNTWVLTRETMEETLPPDGDTWYQSRVCGTFKERAKHSPNQLPVPLLERIVLSCSNPGDLVVDPFAGSGASGVACALHGRNWIGYDISKTCVALSQRRINAMSKGP